MTTIILLIIAAAIGLWVMSTYNALVKNKNLVEEGWSGIETQLKRRANLIPNLVETVKGYATHEKATLEEVTAMRARAMGSESIAERSVAEGALTQALGRLFAVAEAYPDLKANENFQSLQQDLSETEDQIQMARRYYNATVRDNNVKVESFPSNLVAKQFNFPTADYFEIEDDGDRAVPEVKF